MPSGSRGMASTARASVGPALDHVGGEGARDAVGDVGAGHRAAVLPPHAVAQGERPGLEVLARGARRGREVADQAGLLVGVGVRRVGGQRAGEDPAGEGDVVARGDPLGVPGDDRAERERVQRAAVGVDAVTDGRGRDGLLGVGRGLVAEHEHPGDDRAPRRAAPPGAWPRGPAGGDAVASDGSRESGPGACLRCPSVPPGLSSSSPERRRGRAGSGRARPCAAGRPRG